MWGGRFASGPSQLLRRFNDSFSFDHELLGEDIEGSLAWAEALASAGVLSRDECDAIIEGLRAVEVPTSFDDYEDVHSYVEASLRERLGTLAGKLHTGRSRNDQVATDLKLWLRRACDEAIILTTSLAQTLATRAIDEAATPMPGYTHSKQAEPVTFGHWCLAYTEMLRRDLSRFADTRARGNVCPLGSDALSGTPLAIAPDALAKFLGFDRATANSLDGVSDRPFPVAYVFPSSLPLSHLSR